MKRNLTLEESDAFLGPLKDVCSILPTRFFLFEFCYKKYAKQFDDTNTIFWGNKKAEETFYLGFASNLTSVLIFTQKTKKNENFKKRSKKNISSKKTISFSLIQ